MVRIRLKRLGANKKPFFHIVAIDSRTRRDGRELDYLGKYNPLVKGKGRVELFKDKILYWLDKGAIPSDTVVDILKREDIRAQKR